MHEPCNHASHQAERAGEALSRAQDLCALRDLRLTPIRRRVLETLFQTHQPVGAYDLVERMAAGGQKRLAPVTVYRALDFLLEQGLVHRLASRNAFIACPHGHGAQDRVVFLICETCGGVDEVSSPKLALALRNMVDQERFLPHTQLIEMTGLCEHCRTEPRS